MSRPPYNRRRIRDHRSLRQAQQGVALVTALLVVALASVAAVSMATRQALDIRRTTNLLEGDQAWLYAEGAETWARTLLARDAKEGQKDSLDETWATHLPSIEVEGGVLKGKIEDMQGRFNINNLIDKSGKVDPVAAARFQRLLRALKLEPDLAQAVTDWIDRGVDAVPPSGAEDDYYQGLDTPYRTANRAMTDISELRLVKGFDQKTYDQVRPYLSALPAHTPINVNTASAEVLASISDRLDTGLAQAIVAAREKDPFEKLAEFTANPQIQRAGLAARDLQNLSVASSYFLVRSEVAIGQARASLVSLIFRDKGGRSRILLRSQTP